MDARGCSYIDFISHMSPRGNWTLRHPGSAIHIPRHILVEAMPVDTRRLVSKIIIYVNYKAITLVQVDLGAGPVSVDANDRPSEAVWSSIHPSYMPVMVDIFRKGHRNYIHNRQEEQQIYHHAGKLNAGQYLGDGMFNEGNGQTTKRVCRVCVQRINSDIVGEKKPKR